MANETKRTILLVEDEEITYTVLVKSLENAGFTVTHVNNGTSVLDLLQKQTFDLILLDLIIPGISGIDLLSQLKRDPERKDIPVIILSQLNDSDSVSRAVGLGAQGYLVKSDYQLDDIVRKVKEFLKIS